MQKKIFLIIAFLLALGLGLKVVSKIQQTQPNTAGQGKGPQGDKKPPVVVEAVKVKVQDLEDIRSLTGTTLPYSEFTITNKTSGRLEYLKVDEGSFVHKAQLIGKIEDHSLFQQVEQLKADLAVAEANRVENEVKLDIAGRNLARNKALHEKQILSDEELDNSRSVFDTSQAQLQTANAQINQRLASLKLARLKHDDVYIRALWPGYPGQLTVSRRHVEPGAILNANTPIVTLMDISRLKARLALVEKDYGKIKIGQATDITTDAYPDTTFSGKVIRISPRLNEQTHTAEVEIEIANPGHQLKPGMFIRAKLILTTKAKTKTIPILALVKKDKSSGVFEVSSDQQSVAYVPVTLGIVTNAFAEILKPEIKGSVVTLGNHLLKDGAKVTIAGQALSEKPAGKVTNQPPLNKKEEQQKTEDKRSSKHE